ncbi:hypothetical protein QQ020_22520 [Fulvivirgaceae bacterium BMA12]|uniref:Uncharacterized protein n=1 Tax=Agaribacillus aureus TaxID=3051825 RepID=A0ABT8LAT7_9BACT|nr:hypothetical protein [Fulvivirgaceae bacterium BMA12]
MTNFHLILFLWVHFSFPSKRPDKFGIGLIVDDGIIEETVNFATKELEKYFHAKVYAIKDVDLPAEFKRDTINFRKVIEYIDQELPLKYDKNIFLTKRGISPGDWARFSVRGYATLGGRVAVASTLVVKSESTSTRQYENLLAKVLIHEMGHLIGLKHCLESNQCAVVSSLPSPQYFYNAKKQFCKHCLEKIDKALIRKKYRQPKF